MNRGRVVGSLGLLAVAGAILLWQFLAPAAPDRGLAHCNYTLVRVGMSQAEVEALLGGPPGNYGRYADGETGMTMEGYAGRPPGAAERIWCDDAHRFEVYFDAKGRVVGHHRRSSYWQSPREGFFDMLRREIRHL
jgi:hypothetical protein